MIVLTMIKWFLNVAVDVSVQLNIKESITTMEINSIVNVEDDKAV